MDTLGDPLMGCQTPQEKQALMLRGIAFANSKASCQPRTSASPPVCCGFTPSSSSHVFQVKKHTSSLFCQISHLSFSFSSRAPAFLFPQAFFSEPWLFRPCQF